MGRESREDIIVTRVIDFKGGDVTMGSTGKDQVSLRVAQLEEATK